MKALRIAAIFLIANATLLITVAGMALVAGGLALKFDAATAAIVLGVIILADVYLESRRTTPHDR